MIAKGVRFNAEKKQVGNYYSTKVQFIISWSYIQGEFTYANYSQNCVFAINTDHCHACNYNPSGSRIFASITPLVLKVSWNMSNYWPISVTSSCKFEIKHL